jgi:trehalose/maltose transport system permease protein
MAQTSIGIGKKGAKAAAQGQSLTARSTRLAYLLLLPTFLVLIFVAFYPLARTFLASFTDEVFAKPVKTAENPTGQEIANVGLDNYRKLLTMQIVGIPDDKSLADVLPKGPCIAQTSNNPLTQGSCPAGQGELFFRRVSEFQIFGSKFALVATDRDFINSIGNTLIFTLISVGLEVLLGLGVAMVVNARWRGRGAMRAAMLVPWAIPTVVSAKLWAFMLKDNGAGVLNDILVNKLHIFSDFQPWLAQSSLQLPSIILVDVWKTVPYMGLLLLAGLQTIPADIYEAADVDGATKWQQFTMMTLPMLRPTLLVALIFRTLDALRAFDVFSVLLGRSVLSMATYNYEKLTQSQLYGYASAVGVLIFILLFGFTIFYMTTFKVDTD